MKTSYVARSRQYGYVYVRVANRQDTTGTVKGRDVVLSCSGFGRSLQAGGHKYKAYANYRDNGKPVASKDLCHFIPEED